MTTLTLHLEPAAAKIFHYYHDDLKDVQPELNTLFRRFVVTLAEPLWDSDSKKYKNEIVYDPQLCCAIDVAVCQQNGSQGIDFRKAIFIPPHKMCWMNDFVIELLEKEINDTVDRWLEQGAQIQDAIRFVFVKYDIDEHIDYKLDKALKMNQRFRQKQKVKF
jgi:hypothetical protein